MTEIHTTDTLKTVREALCVAQSAMLAVDRLNHASVRKSYHEAVSRLLEDIDRQRPLGSNGKHGKLHTATCGCEDKEQP